MLSMLSVDDGELEGIINELRQYIVYDKAGYSEIPLDLYTKLEDFGIDISKLIQELEKEIHGESDFDNSYWGC